MNALLHTSANKDRLATLGVGLFEWVSYGTKSMCEYQMLLEQPPPPAILCNMLDQGSLILWRSYLPIACVPASPQWADCSTIPCLSSTHPYQTMTSMTWCNKRQISAQACLKGEWRLWPDRDHSHPVDISFSKLGMWQHGPYSQKLWHLMAGEGRGGMNTSKADPTMQRQRPILNLSGCGRAWPDGGWCSCWCPCQ